MLTAILIIISSLLNSALSNPGHCIPCARAYTSNRDLVQSLIEDWCPSEERNQVTDFAVRVNDPCDKNGFSVGRFYYCVPCSSLRKVEDFQNACVTLNHFSKSIDPTEEGIKYPPNYVPCNNPSRNDKNVIFNGECQELLRQESCPDGQWLIYSDDSLKCALQQCPPGLYDFEGNCASSFDELCTKGKLQVHPNGTMSCECEIGTDPLTGECIEDKQSKGICGGRSSKRYLDDNSEVCTPHLCNDVGNSKFNEDDFETVIQTDKGEQSVFKMRCYYYSRDTDSYCDEEGRCLTSFPPCGAFGAQSVLPCKEGYIRGRNVHKGVCVRASHYKLSAPSARDSTDGCPNNMVFDRRVGACLHQIDFKHLLTDYSHYTQDSGAAGALLSKKMMVFLFSLFAKSVSHY